MDHTWHRRKPKLAQDSHLSEIQHAMCNRVLSWWLEPECDRSAWPFAPPLGTFDELWLNEDFGNVRLGVGLDYFEEMEVMGRDRVSSVWVVGLLMVMGVDASKSRTFGELESELN